MANRFKNKIRYGDSPHLYLVEMSGFEPPTPCVQGRCSPAELHPLPISEFGLLIADWFLIPHSAI